jgi:hypothetical protein
MKTNLRTRLVVTCSALLSLTITPVAYAKDIRFDAPNSMVGTIVGPIVMGQKEGENQVKAYHLKPAKTIVLNDRNSTCGTQYLKSLPILLEGFNKYRNKKVKVSASIQCIESRLGSYAIDKIYSIKRIK